jgi:hypothetical protein
MELPSALNSKKPHRRGRSTNAKVPAHDIADASIKLKSCICESREDDGFVAQLDITAGTTAIPSPAAMLAERRPRDYETRPRGQNEVPRRARDKVAEMPQFHSYLISI